MGYMKGIYLTEKSKEEIEAKLAQLEKYKDSDKCNDPRDWSFVSGRQFTLSEILSSATILPVEESWRDLEQQAEEYFPLLDTTNDRTGEIEEENLQILGHRRSFIAGANSKWVQAEKIKAQIDILKKHRLSGEEKFSDTIEELKIELKQLEDEK